MRPHPPFVARQDELVTLLALLERVLEGQPAVALVSGEAGIGKSRLLHELSARAADRGFTVLTGAGVPMGAELLPYAPFVEALREHLRDGSALAPRPGTEAGLSARAYQFERVLALLRHHAEDAPLLVVLEDLHWADQTTLQLLLFLVRSIRSDAIGLVLSWRSDDLARVHPLRQVVAEISRADHAVRLDLPPFGAEETERLLEAAQGSSVEAELSLRIHEQSQGNPFIAQELLAAAGQGQGGVPATLRDVLLARTVDLGEDARTLLRVCAVISGRIEHAVITAAAAGWGHLSSVRLGHAVQDLVDAGVLVPEEDGYRFRHELVAKALYDDILPYERASLHEAVADAIARLSTSDWEWRRPAEIAMHRLAAGQLEEALEAFLGAGDAASRVGAFAEARQQLEKAVELWDRLQDAESRFQLRRDELLLRAAESASLSGDAQRAIALARAALRSAHEDDPERTGLVNMWLGRFLWGAGRGADALDAHERALELVGAAASPARATVLDAYAHALLHAGRFSEARKRAEEGIEIAEQVGLVAEEGRSRRTLGVALVEAGHVAAGLREIEQARDLAVAAGCSDDELDAYEALGDALDRATRLEEALGVLGQGAALAGERGLARVHGAKLLSRQAHCLMRLGRWAQADAVLRDAEALEPSGAIELMVALNRALLAVDRGELDLAEHQLERAAEIVQQGVVAAHERARLAVLDATVKMWRGRLEDSLRTVEEGLRQIASTEDRRHRAELCVLGLAVEADLAERDRAAGDDDAVRTRRAAAQRYMDELEWASTQTVPTGPVELETGAMHLARLEGTAGASEWLALADAWASLQEPWPEAHSRLYAAEAALTSGEDAVAREQLRIARVRVKDLPATAPVVAGIEGLAATMRFQFGDEADTSAERRPDLGLTVRETEVLSLVAEGLTNAEIGRKLFISPKTASVHVTNIMQKLGVNRRAEAAAVALRLGAVPRPWSPG
ncbi:MAG TPA: AAA family ATPase [Egibacteraceae bacterium]|nr:AAA family ATPase [Egibacteraceae bacterium]